MAVKKRTQAEVNDSLLNGDGLSYSEAFDTQDALDQGILGSVVAKTGTWSQEGSAFSHGSSGNTYGVANSDNLGSILGITDAIAANKKRKKEQLMTGNQGFTTSNSILGGGAF